MSQSRKLVISIIIFFLIIVNMGGIAYAAMPLFRHLQGNAGQLGLRLLPETKAPVTDAEIEKTISILRSRFEKLKWNSVTVERSRTPGEEIVVRFPATMDVEEAKQTILEPGRLALKLVAKNTQIPFPHREAAEAILKTLDNTTYEILPYKDRFKEDGIETAFIIVERKAVITSADLRDARAITSQYNTANYQIDFSLLPGGATRFSKATTENVGNYLAIVLNNEVKSAPRIDGPISDRGQITGGFTRLDAEKLAAALSSGELPHEISIVSEKEISATGQAREHLFMTAVLSLTLLLLTGSFIYIVNR